MNHVSYLIETNGENGVHLEYYRISYEPAIEWVENQNSFPSVEMLPDPDYQTSPLYVRCQNGSEWEFYRRTIIMPPKTATFILSILIDGAENNGGYVFDTFTSFFDVTPKSGLIEVLSKTNVSGNEREGVITVTSNQYNDSIEIFILQEYTPIKVWLSSYVSNGLNGESGGEIPESQSLLYKHRFYWLTQKTTIDKETVDIKVVATGPRNGYIIKDISKYVYKGALDESCIFSAENEKYYRLVQKYTKEGFVTLYEEIIFDDTTQGVYEKVKYLNDLRIYKKDDIISITNYGRCFLEPDAYYVLTLANVDDINNTCRIIIRYVESIIPPIPPTPVIDNYLTFTALQPNSTVQLTKVGEPSDVELEYSLDGGESWNEYAIEQTITLQSTNNTVKFKGNNNNFSNTLSNCYKFVLSGLLSASGDVTSLLNENCGDISLGGDTFTHLFDGCTPLVTAPKLPSTSLNRRCYAYMFNGCTSLTTAPELPSTALDDSCYFSMFSNCTSLETPPALPATVLYAGCYGNMFYGCTSLTTAPELPATTLAMSCYTNMFNSCVGLTTAPALPATTLARRCYGNMFNGCVALTTAPALPATVLAEGCYGAMFQNCSSLITPPMLPATTLAVQCYQAMFNGCAALTTAPALPATTLAQACYYTMFQRCASLTKAPDLPATILEEDCYFRMFYNCSNLSFIKALFLTTPSTTYTDLWVFGVSSTGTFIKNCAATWDVRGEYGIPRDWDVPYCVEPDSPLTFTANTAGSTIKLNKFGNLEDKNLWYRTNNMSDWVKYTWNNDVGYEIVLTNIGDCVSIIGYNRKISETGTNRLQFVMTGSISASGDVTSLINSSGGDASATTYVFTKLFQDCTALTTAPRLPITVCAGHCYMSMFKGCTSLTVTPQLPATTLANYCYMSMFEGCTSLIVSPALNATVLTTHCYSSMFSGCTSLSTAPELPATTLEECCYLNMFSGCTSLSTAPDLPATTLMRACYDNMFSGCTSLTTAPDLPATILVDNCYNNMFNRCSNLNHIKALFTTTPSINYTSYWVNGVAASGTFIKNASATWTDTGVDAVPSGWTIQTE